MMSTASITSLHGLTINKGVFQQLSNRFVSWILRSSFHGVFGLDRVAMVLTYTGRKSGQRYTLPLAYTRNGQIVTTFALFTNTVWWKNLRGDAVVTVRVAGRDYKGHAEIVTDPEEVTAGLLKFVAHNPQMTSRGYYALPRNSSGQIDTDALRETAESRVMVTIRLDPQSVQTSTQNSQRMKALMRVVVRMHSAIYRLSGGTVWGRISGIPVLLLTTIGRKTGRPFTVPLTYFKDQNQYIVVGAMGGAPTDPAWVHNLRQHPHVLVQHERHTQEMCAAITDGDERTRIWSQLVTQFPGFAAMQQRTERQFPIVTLRTTG